MGRKRQSDYTLKFNLTSAFLVLFLGCILLGVAAAGGYYFGFRAQVEDASKHDPLSPLQRGSPATASSTPGDLPTNIPTARQDDEAVRQVLGQLAPPQPALPTPPAITPVTDVPNTQPPVSDKAWVIQISSRPDLEAAENDIASLQAKGLPARIEPITIREELYYRVRVGVFASKEEAEKYALALAHRDIIRDYWITER